MKKIMRLLFVMIITASLLSVQTLSAFAADEGSSTGEVRISLLGKYDSADTASVKQINTISKTIQFRNHDTGKNYTLKYDNTSQIYDIHGEPVSASMLEVGQVVDITFLRGIKHLNSLIVSDDAWVEAGVHDFSLVSDDETAKINGKVLHITRKTLIVSDGQAVNPEDILETDTLRVSGIDKEIYSIVVTRGHGYVSLSSDTVNNRSLVGAWIELDKEVIRKITPKMLISAPEGSYNVNIAGNGTRFSSEIIVNRNEETVIDTSVVEVEEVKEGNVTFVVTPEESRVFVDGKEVLTEVPQSFTYGKHKLHVMSEGYKSQDHYLKVAEPDATLFIELEKNEEDSSNDSSSEESSADSAISDSETSISADTSSSANETRTVVEDGSTSNSASTATSQRNNSNANRSATAATTSSNASTTATVDPSAATTSTTIDASDSSTSSSDSSNSDSTSDSGDSSSEDEEDENVISGYKVSFDAPIGAEAYLDGNYVGIIPVSFAKVAGQHMVTLQKEGYQTKSYTIQIDSEKTNVTYTFPEMAKEKSPTDDSDNSNSSDNGDTGNTSDNGDTSDNSGNTDTGNSSDNGNTGNSAGNGDTGNGSNNGSTGNSSNNGNTGNSSDNGNTGNNSGTEDTGNGSDSGNGSGGGNTENPSEGGNTENPSEGGNSEQNPGSGESKSNPDGEITDPKPGEGEEEKPSEGDENKTPSDSENTEETEDAGETEDTGETGGAATITVNP